MAGNAVDGTMEWDELPVDGSDAWFGLLLCALSGVASLKILGWLAAAAEKIIMP